MTPSEELSSPCRIFLDCTTLALTNHNYSACENSPLASDLMSRFPWFFGPGFVVFPLLLFYRFVLRTVRILHFPTLLPLLFQSAPVDAPLNIVPSVLIFPYL